MVSWFVGSLQSPGCKRVGVGCIFYLSSGAFEAPVENQQWIGTELEDIHKDPSLSLNHISSLF